jgi:hypothetical protein
MRNDIPIRIKLGIQIQTNSLFNMLIPRSEKKLAALIGETRMGRHGKKYLSVEMG